MKQHAYGLTFGIVLFLLLPVTGLAMTEEECTAMYPLPKREVNGVVEHTGHDPRRFLIRRCISKVRAETRKARQVERDLVRAKARYERSSANTSSRRIQSEHNTQRAIRRQNLKEMRFRASTHTLDRTPFYQARQTRRALIRGEEGVDRINAIRRLLMKEKSVDPCTTVGAVRKFNNPCKRYGSLQDE